MTSTAARRAGVALLIALFLISMVQHYGKKADCREKLNITKEALLANPEIINQVLKDCGYPKVRIFTEEQYLGIVRTCAQLIQEASGFA